MLFIYILLLFNIYLPGLNITVCLIISHNKLFPQVGVEVVKGRISGYESLLINHTLHVINLCPPFRYFFASDYILQSAWLLVTINYVHMQMELG